MDKNGDQIVHGALISGPDGRLYFIPSDELNTFEVPDDMALPVKAALQQVADNERINIPGDRVTEVSTGVYSVPSFMGPLGRREIAMGPNDPTQSAAIDWGGLEE